MAGHCDNCGEMWHPGTEEHDWQKCSACGWSPGDEIEEDDEDDEFESDIDEYIVTDR